MKATVKLLLQISKVTVAAFCAASSLCPSTYAADTESTAPYAGNLLFTVSVCPEKTNIFYEVYFAESLTPPDWQVISSAIQGSGETRITLRDVLPITNTLRQGFYKLGRMDIDSDENGIPDAREQIMHVHDLAETNRARWARAGFSCLPFYTITNSVKAYGAVGDGKHDDATAFQLALNNAPSGSVVYIPPGVYRITQPLYMKPYTVLRGSGAALSSLLFQGAGTAGRCIGIIRWDSQQTAPYVTPTGGWQQGSTELLVSSANGFSAGDIIEIEMDNDPAWGLNESWQARLPGQIVRIVGVEATRLYLERPLRIDFPPDRNARVRRLNMISGAGVEDLYITRLDAVNGYTIEMKYADRCWVRGVEGYNTYKAHVWIERGYACEVRDSYFHHSHVYGGGGQGYGVSCGRHTSDTLVENNIFDHLRHSMIVGSGANGNVFAYNFSTNRARDPVYGTPQPDISVHGNYVFMNLFEGNAAEDADMPDWYHPAGPGNTLFRNRIINIGTAIEIGSCGQHALGNELLRGEISRQGEIHNITDYGNYANGVLTWPGCPCQNLPESLFRPIPAALFSSDDPRIVWPPFGPPNVPGSTLIPAQARYESGAFIPYAD